MGKYYLETIVLREDGTAVAPTIAEYPSRDEAERAYHHVLAQNIDNEAIEFVRSTVINTQGGAETGLSEYWKAEVPQPEPDPEDPEPTPVVDETKYYFTQIRYKESSSQRVVTPYDTKDEAVVAFHNLLYSVMADAQYKAVMCRITDKYGSQAHDTRYWERS